MFFVRNEASKESGMRSTVWIGRLSYQLNPGETIRIPEDYLMADLRRFLNKTKNVLGHIKVYTLDEYNEKYVHPSLGNDHAKKEKDTVNIEERVKVEEEVKVDVDDEDTKSEDVKEETTSSDRDASYRSKLNKKKKN